nr:hypothetical protein [Tanacetum cinerariifolium]
MTTLAKHMIVPGADNRPPMLEKYMYNSWSSRMLPYIKGKEHGRIMLNSILEGPLVYGLPPDVYSLVNHQQVAKQIWDQVKLLMKGIELTRQECQCKLYNEFDSFPPEWSKFVIDVKLAKDMHESNYDQLYAYLSSHEAHAIEVRVMREREYNEVVQARVVSVTIVNEKGIWQDNALSLKGQGTQHDPGVAESQITHTTITHNAAFHTDDLDAFDSDCDKAPGAKAVVTANLSSYDSDVISEENVAILLEFKEITNIVTQCTTESLKHKNVNESLTVELERYKKRVKMVKERQKVDLNKREKYIDS